MNTVLQNEFIPTILLPTRVTSHACTLIDHIYHQSRNSRIQILSGNLMADMRDHFANFMILHSKHKNIAVDRPMVRIFSDKKKTKFQNIFKYNRLGKRNVRQKRERGYDYYQPKTYNSLQ